MSAFKYSRLQVFDNLELFASEDEVAYFPFHFHEYFCISVITKGTEQLFGTEQSYFIPAGYIGITQYNEVHRNTSWSEEGYSYKTIYVHPSLLTYFNNGQPVYELERAIFNPSLFQLLNSLISHPGSPITLWEQAFRQLVRYAVTPSLSKLRNFTLADELLAEEPSTKIETGWLARQCFMSKFHFIHEFRKARGITPQTYIMIKRLELARKALLQGGTMKEVAFNHGFYDASHFATAFRRYYGVTPHQYRK